MRALERHEFAPGQRLGETDLALQFGVGRNAVREAIQWLAAHGAVDLSRYRSPIIRRLDGVEALDVLDVAEPLIALIAERAATSYLADKHSELLDSALQELHVAQEDEAPGSLSRARRHVYNALLQIGANRELQRLFPALGLHILFAQYDSTRLRRLMDVGALLIEVRSGDAGQARAVVKDQMHQVRAWIATQAAAARS